MVDWWVPYVSLFVAALATAVLTTPLARKIAWKLDAVDYPSARRINKRPIPRMGGIAIFLALAVAVAVQYVGTTRFHWPVVLVPSPRMTVDYYRLALAFLIIFVTGLVDDMIQLKPLPKLLGQVAAAVVAVSGGLVIGDIVNPFVGGEVTLGWLTYPITVIYLVAYVNIINLIDGLDGLATGITCISSITMFVLASLAGRLDAAALSIALAGATLGFLCYNFHPASIFLGDSGSLLLGFALGTISLLNVTRVAGLTTIILPLLIAGIPIMDTFSAIIRRKRAHVSVSHADKGHIHHRLIHEGFDQRQAVLLMYAWTALLCLGSFLMTQVEVWPRVIIFALLIAASAGFAMRLHLFEPVLRHHYDDKTGEDTIVTPEDPAFAEERDAAEERREERHEELRERIHGGHESDDQPDDETNGSDE
ncbi:MAG: undecaprenyl/decaprenyl-phosphate alpha-N-acetylglucosaminyl 1-phosphate transferase [Atopobiaceae bacterium]|nr:undecaprenyl/decaprenyl-phosphate alpha-N-acetylglucosaminyl 1-phosphate transferase [Atopobiaceae bacterium]MCI2172844.1 undecaprenyl/decaprenyl-phosphate alpha-N-acetylglucosaminyl 1-phosphate transferase [Atopobiaceae bacterium]MCI2207151.1 undecaprenyl/decaprenyl-phosphate alpha-N-acetylglucosaminyl 1-phosphate transferase [Atopobiaceae bacterium]